MGLFAVNAIMYFRIKTIWIQQWLSCLRGCKRKNLKSVFKLFDMRVLFPLVGAFFLRELVVFFPETSSN